MTSKSVYKTEEGKRAVLSVYAAILQGWPVPYETRDVDTRHGCTFVIACGDKALPPLFLIHGSGSNAAMWIGDVAEYSQHFCVYAVDIPGEAGKSHDVRPDLRTHAHAEWLNDVFAALGIDQRGDRWDIIGWLGGDPLRFCISGKGQQACVTLPIGDRSAKVLSGAFADHCQIEG